MGTNASAGNDEAPAVSASNVDPEECSLLLGWLFVTARVPSVVAVLSVLKVRSADRESRPGATDGSDGRLHPGEPIKPKTLAKPTATEMRVLRHSAYMRTTWNPPCDSGTA